MIPPAPQPAGKAEARQANTDVPIIKLPAKSQTASVDPQAILSEACGGDKRCICVNNAIFKHDSSWCTAGVGKKTNNCGNMRPPSTWKPSVPFSVFNSVNGPFCHFQSLEHGIKANVELYKRFYKDMPPDRLVSVWTDGGDESYRKAVRSCFL